MFAVRTLAQHVAMGPQPPVDLARVLIVHGELTPRLTLRTLLEAGGYAVDVAGTLSEAMAKLDESEYELVLSGADRGANTSPSDVLAYAKVKDYRPATARIVFNESSGGRQTGRRHLVAVHTEDVPMLLGKVADLIAIRAQRRYRPARSAF